MMSFPLLLMTSVHQAGGSLIGSLCPLGSPPANLTEEGASVLRYSADGVHICKNRSGNVNIASKNMASGFLDPRPSKIFSQVFCPFEKKVRRISAVIALFFSCHSGMVSGSKLDPKGAVSILERDIGITPIPMYLWDAMPLRHAW
jgi:hypothetical protein